jgi:hypothetical protein
MEAEAAVTVVASKITTPTPTVRPATTAVAVIVVDTVAAVEATAAATEEVTKAVTEADTKAAAETGSRITRTTIARSDTISC